VSTAESEFGPTGEVEEAEEHRVTPLELFFDLVFVLSFTQVTAKMAEDPTWGGVGEGMLVLTAVWWAWAGYAWLTNAIDPSEDLNRFLVFVAMAAMLVVSLAVPGAFGDEAILFGCAYFVVRAIHLLLYIRTARQQQGGELMKGVLSMAPAWLISPALIILAGLFDGTAQAAIWIAALAIDYGSAFAGSSESYRVHAGHFSERFGLIIIIALGESIVAIGSGAGFLVSDLEVLAAVFAIVLAAALWWAYFGVASIVAERRLVEAGGAERALLARDSYALLHLPMIAGIVLLALGIKKTLADVEVPLKEVPAVALCGGVALFLLAHIAFRLRNVGTLATERLVTAGICLALIPLAMEVDAWIALAAVTAVVAGHIAHVAYTSREGRARVLADPNQPLARMRGRELRDRAKS
jgi:low temperature requirement protein LtrA